MLADGPFVRENGGSRTRVELFSAGVETLNPATVAQIVAIFR